MADEPRPGQPHLEVPWGVRLAAEWSWRLLVVAAAVGATVLLVARLRVLGIALFVAVLVSALLAPAVERLARTRVRRGGSTAIVLLGSLVGLVVVGYGVGNAIAGQFGDLSEQFGAGLDKIREWLRTTFGIEDSQLQDWLDQIVQAVQENKESLASGALSTATVALEVLSGAAIALFATVFFLYEGPRIWAWLVSLLPDRAQPGAREAGTRSWVVLTGYVRGTVLIAFVDGFFIGLAVAVIGVPLAMPLGVLVFFGAFVPIVGATVTGFVAVVVALASEGVVSALLVLAAVVLVQQLEGHILQPLVMGRMVALHPLGVVLAVAAGTLLAGLVGAVIAVPLAAVGATVLGYYRERSRAPGAAAEPAEPAEPAEEAGLPPPGPVAADPDLGH
jgi:predicted PurR-regulated permease PerM